MTDPIKVVQGVITKKKKKSQKHDASNTTAFFKFLR